MQVPGSCGYDWTQDTALVSASVLSGALTNSPLDDPAWQSLLAFFVLSLAAPMIGRFAKHSIGAHPLAGCMLLGFLVCAPVVHMLPMTLAREHLGMLATFCRAFVAVETAVHVAPLRELLRHRWGILASGVTHGAGSFALATCCVPWLTLWWSKMMWSPGAVVGTQALPVMVGAYALAASSAVGIVAAAAEPTCSAQLFHEAGAAGLFTSISLRSTSADFLFSIGLLLIGGPFVATAWRGAHYAILSSIASVLLTLAVAAIMSLLFYFINRARLRRRLQSIRSAPVFGRAGARIGAFLHSNAADLDRIVKGVTTLGVSMACFNLATMLERADGGDGTPSDALYSCVSTGAGCMHVNTTTVSGLPVCAVNYRAAHTGVANVAAASPPSLLPFCRVSFQPWAACFLASFFVCTEAFVRKPGAKSQWQLMLQPWSSHVLLMLGTLAGMWLPYPGVLGVPGAVAATLFVLRVGVVSMASSFVAVATRLPQRYIAAAPLRPILQAQVALCFVWELSERAPALRAYPFDFTVIGSVLIFLELCLGPPLLRTAIRLAGEMHVDRVGQACVLGAEGSPPVITLKLFQWEVHAGASQSHVAELVWTVRDVETTLSVDEASIRQILLDAKPVAFVSMLQDDSLNFNACQLMLGSFDVPRCIVKCIDPAWMKKFAILQPRSAVCFVQHLTTSVRNTLNQFVQSAQSAAVLLGDDPGAGVLRVTMTEMEHGVRIRDLRIPEDVQVLGIQRELDLSGPISSCAASADTRHSSATGSSDVADVNCTCGGPETSCRSLTSSTSCASIVDAVAVGAAALERTAARTTLKRTSIMPHGHTMLQLNDEVTICGRPDSLASITGLRRGKVVLQT